MEKQRINFIIPYFGEFPNYFQYFLNSCRTNNDIDWTIITDNKSVYDYPSNVHIVKSSFAQVKKQIQECFEFRICLDTPYKLCEYRPAYGYIFSNLLQGYDFWGYCDVDVIYGRIRKFVTSDILQSYNKIFHLGHMTLIRNDRYYNELFRKEVQGRCIYKEVFTKDGCFNFDEDFKDNININTLFLDSSEKIYRKDDVIADIYVKSNFFRLTQDEWVESYTKSFFLWENGVLTRILQKGKKIEKKEYLYIHLQKRKMKINAKLGTYTKRFLIIPNSFEPINKQNLVSKKEFDKVKKWSPNLHYIRIRYKNLKIKLKKFFSINLS